MSNLKKQFEALEKFCDGALGVSARHIETDNEIHFNADERFLMCSTYKVAIGIYFLFKVQNGDFHLNDLLEIKNTDLRPGILGTLNQLNYDVAQQISLHNILRFMMQESCNASTDILLKMIGGPNAVMRYLVKIHLPEIKVHTYTIDVISQWDGIKNLPENFSLAQYKQLEREVSPENLKLAQESFKKEIDRTHNDTTTPRAMTQLLTKLFANELIEPKFSKLLLDIMRGCKRGANRLMGILPTGTPVSHKTGTLTGFTCDVGIIALPHNAGHIALSAYIKKSNKDLINNERVLAEIGRTVYDFFLFKILK